MKKLVILFSIFMSTHVLAQHGTINIQTNLDSTVILQYSIDTLESYQVGPGIIYTRFDITNSTSTRHCYVYEVDLTNPYNTIEESHSTTMGNTERMVDAHARLDSAGHRSIGSVNCNFWIVSSQDEGKYNNLTGVPCTGQVRNGKIGTNITWWNIGHGEAWLDRKQDIGYLMIDDQKKAHIDQYYWDAHLAIGDQAMPINEVNRNRNNPGDNDLVMFNSDMGTRATLTKADIDAYLGNDLPLIEVVVKLEQDWAINEHLFAEVVSINTTGGTKIEDGYAVFRGRGNGKTFLENAKVGDRVQFIIGMYESYLGTRPKIKQLSAGNCYVMNEGKLTIRNWNEDYNNKNYPRTGFGVSKDHNTLWLMVMEKPGMYTHEMASILRHFGAWEAAGADGGGSAQFNLGGQILNPTTEGTPRAVGNSIFLFSTAPDDPVVTEMRTASTFLRLPKYAAIKPDFLGYNQYGMLIDKKLQGVELSCAPETGYITDDGYFVCLGSGILTAKYGNASLPIDIVLVDAANPKLRLDSVIVSTGWDYPIEINGELDNKQFDMLPSAFTWVVDDPTICQVEEGVLKGLKNGRTTIHGTIGDITLHLIVKVEAPEQSPYLWENMIDINNRWTMKTTSSGWKTSFAANSDNSAELYINYTGGRAPHVTLTADSALYSTPHAMEMRITPQGDLIEKIIFTFQRANDKNKYVYTAQNLVANEKNNIYIDFNQLFEVEDDHAIYPILLTTIKFSILSNAAKQEYRIPIEGIYLHYKGISGEETAVKEVKLPYSAQKILHNGQLIIINNNKIYNILGHEITEKY
ncbi:MAG: phosphodiester glycosidase family protein [Paludibacteraceae bacterium]|nr:phosphodiester glycosidase family protein [Paludibacteraceae bacterium]